MNKKVLNNKFKELKVDAIISEASQTRLWYADIQTSDGYIVIEPNKAYLFVDGRYIEYCQNNAKNVEVVLLQGAKTLGEFFDKKKYKSVAFEKDYLKYETFEYLANLTKVKESNIKWIAGQELRICKSLEEVEKLEKSIWISLDAYDELMKQIKPGQTEKEVAALLNYIMKQKGAQKEGFDEIVAIGPSSAEPHHHPTDRKIEKGELLKIDYGALYKGYTADITRTCIFGGEETVKNPEALKILNIVKAAAKAGRDAVKPGIKAYEIDKICREYIEKAGYGEYFVHSTGHGLGIDVHELPYVNARSNYTLEPGMVITVEPGIYIEGLGGARIEDDVLVVKQGRYVLSRKDERDPLEV